MRNKMMIAVCIAAAVLMFTAVSCTDTRKEENGQAEPTNSSSVAPMEQKTENAATENKEEDSKDSKTEIQQDSKAPREKAPTGTKKENKETQGVTVESGKNTETDTAKDSVKDTSENTPKPEKSDGKQDSEKESAKEEATEKTDLPPISFEAESSLSEGTEKEENKEDTVPSSDDDPNSTELPPVPFF